MRSDSLISIRESLLSRTEEIASRWCLGALHDPDKRNGAPEELIEPLKQIVIESIDILTSETFDPSKARELGTRASKLKLGGNDLLCRTQEILTYEFTKELSKEELNMVYHDLTSLMANFTSGYHEDARNGLQIEQGRICEALMHDLLMADQKLRKTNEELEANVEERTAELKRLNKELKTEVDMRIKTETDLKQREYLLSVAFDTSFLWTGLLDPQGRIILPNKQSVDFLGLKKEDVIGHLFWESPWWSHSKELQAKVKKAVMEAKKGTSSKFDVHHIDTEGNRQDVQFSIRPVKNNSGEVIYLIPEGVNITERKCAERNLQKARDEMKALLENTNDIYFSINGEGTLTFIGPQIKKFGYDPEDVIGENISILMQHLHPDEIKEAAEMFERRFKELDESPSTYRLLDPKGGIKWMEESIKILSDENKNVISINGIIRDITPRKEAEEELRNLNKVLMLVNKIMRHDIRNRLSVAYGLLGLMKERKTYEPDLIKEIDVAVKRSIELTERMADLENLVQSKEGMKEYDIEELISPIMGEYPLDHSINGNSRVLADEAIVSVFDNLISNALVHGKATRVDFKISTTEGICTIKVSNDGTAIPEGIRDMIFDESFSWGDEKGSGLGLYITGKVIERYGGEITLVDGGNGDTIFEIKLPMVKV